MGYFSFKDITMKIITQWQALQALAKHNPFYQDLFHYIFQAVENPTEMTYSDYWMDSTLIILNSHEDPSLLPIINIQHFILSFPHAFRPHIDYLLHYPEYTERFGENHYLSLAIFDSYGNGIFLVFDNVLAEQCDVLKNLIQESYDDNLH